MSSPSQASNSVATLTQANITEFDKNFVENLKGETPHIGCMDIRYQSEHAGINRAHFMYQPLGSNTQQVADGTIGSPITLTVNQQNMSLGEYGDFATISAFGQFASLDDATLNVSKELGYRAALSLNALAQATTDSLSSVDSTVASTTSSGTVLDLATFRGLKQSLVHRSVQPVRGGKMCGVID